VIIVDSVTKLNNCKINDIKAYCCHIISLFFFIIIYNIFYYSCTFLFFLHASHTDILFQLSKCSHAIMLIVTYLHASQVCRK